MHRFWGFVIRPILDKIGAKHLVEIGCDSGKGTEVILEYCKENHATLSAIDPFPKFDPDLWKEKYGSTFKLHQDLSLTALPLIKDYDIVFVDGDHNWYTVYNELKIIEKFNSEDKFPVIIAHDVGWPYGKRDLYYNPENIPELYRQPFKKAGLHYKQGQLANEGGLNPHLNHSIYENNPRNGVLTAVQDFLEETSLKLDFIQLSGIFGLGIIVPQGPIADYIRLEILPKAKNELIEILEAERIQNIIKANEIKFRLENSIAKLKDKHEEEKKQLNTVNSVLKLERAGLEKASKQAEDKYREILTLANYRNEQIKELNQKVKEIEDSRKALQAEIKAKEKALRSAQFTANVHLNSVRYRLGDVIISALKPSKNTLLAPFRVFKLLKEGLKKQKDRELGNEVVRNSSNTQKTNAAQNNTPNVNVDKKEPGFIQYSSEFAAKAWSSSQVESTLKELDKQPVSIIVPIYNAYEETVACVQSVLKNTSTPYELVLINDCSPDERIKPFLEQLSDKPQIRVVNNETNKGFVENVNIGLNMTSGDVVLLNSDTIVTPRWLQKLVLAAYSQEDIGTVTPVSNAAGAFSVPKAGANEVPKHLGVEGMGRLVEKVSRHLYPSVPTGNGFCMFIKRKTIQQVGLFDTDNFKRGYGEENDFCMRAGYKGWKHIVDDSTYIYHKRSASFSQEKEELIKKNRAILDELHPTYTQEVSRAFKMPVFTEFRERIQAELFKSESDSGKYNKKRLLYVIHAGGGGTPQTNMDLMTNVNDEYDCFLLVANIDEIKLWQLKDKELQQLAMWSLPKKWLISDFYNEAYQKIYYQVLVNLKIDAVHIRHLIAHTFDIARTAKHLGLPVTLSFHDFYYVCPTVHLLDEKGSYCKGVCSGPSGECKVPGNWIKDMPKLKSSWIHVWRQKVQDLFEYCSAFVTTSDYTKKIYTQTFPILKEKSFLVIEHGRDLETVLDDEMVEFPQEGKKIKILLPGNIGKNKGADFIKELKRIDRENKIEFHFLGPVIKELEGFGIEHGAYKRDEFEAKVKGIKPSFVGIFSNWPETYCHTLSEAWSCGIPVLASKIGTIEERVVRNGGGWLVDFTNPSQAYQQILEIAANREEYLKVRNRIKDISFKTCSQMANEYKGIYTNILKRD